MGLLNKSFPEIVKGIQKTSRATLVAILLLGVVLVVSACGSQDGAYMTQ